MVPQNSSELFCELKGFRLARRKFGGLEVLTSYLTDGIIVAKLKWELERSPMAVRTAPKSHMQTTQQ
jgi:hypothetical protein